MISKARPAQRLTLGLPPGSTKPGTATSGITPQPPLCADKRGDTGRGPLAQHVNGDDRNVRLVTPGKGKTGTLTSGDVIKGS